MGRPALHARALLGGVVLGCVLVALAVVPAAGSAGSAGASGRGPAWVPPLDGRLVVRRGFDPPARDWHPGHRGVDLAGASGEPVRAAGAGIIAFAGVLAGRGVVTVRHGALRTTYEPVVASVAVGAVVAAGQPIGRLAPGHGLPRAGEALLHWGLRRGEAYLDPLRLLDRGPPRLLPHWSAPQEGKLARSWSQAGATRPGDGRTSDTTRARRVAGRSAEPEPGTPDPRAAAALLALSGGAALGIAVRRRR